jgi:hypothetical protein
VRHRIDYADDVVRVSVSRRCLDTPRVVRFRLLSEQVRRSWSYAWLDNGLAVSFGDRRWTRWLARGGAPGALTAPTRVPLAPARAVCGGPGRG